MLVRPWSCNGLQGLALEWHVNEPRPVDSQSVRVASLHVYSSDHFTK